MGRIILNNEEYTGSSGSAPVTDVTVNGSSVVNAQGVAEVTVPDELSDLADDSTHRTVTDTEKSTWSGKVSDNPTFTEAQTRANIASGESFATILGKIKKFFTDLKTVAFTGAYSDLSGTENVAVKNANNRFSQSQIIDAKNGTVSTDGYSYISVGNGTPSGTSGNSFGIVEIYGKGSKYVDLKASNVTANRNIELPDKNGTVALTSDIPDISTKVTKSGDTMTGKLTIDAAYSTPLAINRTNDAGKCYLGFGNSNGTRGYFAVGDDKLPYFEPAGGSDVRIALLSDVPTNNNQLTNGAGYITADGTSKTAKMLFSQTDNMGFYETNDTHFLQLGYIKADDYANISLLVSSSFYGVQHGSTDILNVIQDYTRSSRYFYRIRLDNRTTRRFFGEQVGDKFYIWVYVNGGNSYGQWNVSVIQTNNNNIDWVDDKKKNQPVRSTWTEFGYSGTVYQATANVLKSGDTMTGDLTVEGTLTAYNFMNLYSDVFDKQITISLPTSLTANRNVSFPNKGGTIAMTSDISSRRYKENIIPLSEDEAKKILDVEIVNYDYKENVVDEDERYDQKGAIAEDVVNLIPNAVTYADIDGEQLPDGINYTKFIPYLIKMVQIQQKEIEELKAMIKEVSK